jgi:hypothetical protein
VVAVALTRKFDLALISLLFPHPQLRIVPLFDEELLAIRPSDREREGSRT